MKKLVLPLLLMINIISLAKSPVYHRFWQGYKNTALSSQQFIDGLNTLFIPATVKTGINKGLIAYQPVITLGIKALPAEIALVSYQNKKTYQQLFSTNTGEKYQHLHWHYFTRQSHSIVPEAYRGRLEIHHAYDQHPHYAAWMQNKTALLITYRKTGESQSHLLNRLNRYFKKSSPTLDRILLVTPKYGLEYVSYKYKLNLKADVVIHLNNTPLQQVDLHEKQGANIQF